MTNIGAAEVLQILNKQGPLTASEIEELTECGMAAVKTILRKLIKDPIENVEFKQLTNEEKLEKYGRQTNCKIYLYWLNE